MEKQIKIAVAGMGYVGLSNAVLLARKIRYVCWMYCPKR